jgi:hypothetical protein
MRCASCGFENEAGAQFCEECGTPLVRSMWQKKKTRCFPRLSRCWQANWKT